jgi:hypothetical protein
MKYELGDKFLISCNKFYPFEGWFYKKKAELIVIQYDHFYLAITNDLHPQDGIGNRLTKDDMAFFKTRKDMDCHSELDKFVGKNWIHLNSNDVKNSLIYIKDKNIKCRSECIKE